MEQKQKQAAESQRMVDHQSNFDNQSGLTTNGTVDLDELIKELSSGEDPVLIDLDQFIQEIE